MSSAASRAGFFRIAPEVVTTVRTKPLASRWNACVMKMLTTSGQGMEQTAHYLPLPGIPMLCLPDPLKNGALILLSLK